MSQNRLIDYFEIAKLFKLVYRDKIDDLDLNAVSASISIDKLIRRQSCLQSDNLTISHQSQLHICVNHSALDRCTYIRAD